MIVWDDDTALVFNLESSSPFSFKCMRCSVCCVNRTIKIGAYEGERLARRKGITPSEFFERYTESEEHILRLKSDGTCIFLIGEGCGVHPDRPLVCRLYPLGLLTGPDGKMRISRMPPHPDCLGVFGRDGTVATYFESEGAIPYFVREKKPDEAAPK